MNWTKRAQILAVVGLTLLPVTRAAAQTTFDPGSIVIPMDAAWQDQGILDAYGLVYALLSDGIEVHWIIEPTKVYGGPDLVDIPTYLTTETPAAAVDRTFSGGPFMIAQADAASAVLVIDLWQGDGWDALAYYTDASVTAEVSRTLLVAPTIAIFEDGEEDIAWDYLNAAGIPDSNGDEWDAGSPGNLSMAEISGADDNLIDGVLFDDDGYPAFCHLNAMHWGDHDPEAVVMEVREFAEDRFTSALFECEASETIENEPTYGFFLSSGIDKVGLDRNNATFVVSDPTAELMQMVGDWGPHGGSLPDFEGTFDPGVIFVTGDDGSDVAHVVATGRTDDDASKGKVSFLGGHEYDLGLPYSSNAEINGVRVFLNSYYTADCGSLSLAPVITLTGAVSAVNHDVTLVLDYENTGPGRGRNSILVFQVPVGLVYVSDDGGGIWDPVAGTVTWDLETIESGETDSIQIELSAAADGTYLLAADLEFYVEATAFFVDWSDSVTVTLDTDGDGLSDEDEINIHGTDPLDPDTDDDGLLDGEEVLQYGTDPLDPDTDGDGLLDGEEVLQYGTDPLDPDTDADGLLDGEEVLQYGTDPLDPDTDADGLLDGEEVLQYGTDPLNPDTDGEGLLDGEEVNTHGTDPLNPDTDGDGCDDHEEVVVMGTRPLNPDTDGDGIGDCDEAGFGTDPLDSDSDDDGLLDGEEINLGTDPLNPDTDADGLLDGDEVHVHGTDPLDSDSDDDGLLDGDEVLSLGTDPLDEDTDDDGLLDGAEVLVHGTDPLNPDTDADGLLDGEEINTHGTDPLNPDTDGEGLLDGEEVNTYGTDPLNPDTDGDGCNDHDEVMTLGTDPLNPDTDGDGLGDCEEAGYGTDPLDDDSDDDGVNDGDEIDHGTDPLDDDSDDDGLLDGEEDTLGTDPLDPDTDDDGLLDGDEVHDHLTDPLDEDTDDGGVNDGDEVDQGTDPLDPSDDFPGDDDDDSAGDDDDSAGDDDDDSAGDDDDSAGDDDDATDDDDDATDDDDDATDDDDDATDDDDDTGAPADDDLDSGEIAGGCKCAVRADASGGAAAWLGLSTALTLLVGWRRRRALAG